MPGSSFSRLEVANACRTWGAKLWTPNASLDGPQLLWMLSGCESSFGANCKPRHEPLYHHLATDAIHPDPTLVRLTKLFGCDAHCSFGPWQLLLVNAVSQDPASFVRLEFCAMETVGFINRRIFAHLGATTLEHVAAAYNSGTFRHDPMPDGVARYIEQAQRYYLEPMPTA